MTTEFKNDSRFSNSHELTDRGVPGQRIRCRVVLPLFLLVSAFCQAQNSPAKSADNTASAPHDSVAPAPITNNKHVEGLSVPDNIELASGELVPVADIIPRADAAQQQLQQIIVKLRASEVDPLIVSLNQLNQRVDGSRPGAQDVIKAARSPLQLTEPRIAWAVKRSELESIDATATQANATIEGLRQQNRTISEYWAAMATAAAAAHLPAEIVQRIAGVQNASEATRGARREEADQLIQLQVQLSETRAKIDAMIEQIDAKDTALRNQLFALDSPPLWSALRSASELELRHEIQNYLVGANSRSIGFLLSYRYKLLLYVLLSFGILAIVTRLCQSNFSGQNTGVDSNYFASLQHPIEITVLLVLLLFGAVFPQVPSELLRLLRLMLTVPVALIGFSFVDRRLRPFVVAVSAFYVVNLLSLQAIAGTLLRRLIVLLLTSSLLAALIYLLRKKGLLRAFFVERRMTFMFVASYVAAILLLVAIFSNLVGNVSLADLLANGTIVSMYWSVALYVLYAVGTALTVAFTASAFACRSRALRLHGELVNRRAAFYLKLLTWAVWIFAVLVSFQASTEALAAGREVLYHEWKVGAVSLSPFGIVLFLLVLTVGSMIARFTRFMLDEEVLPRTSMDSGAAQAGSRLTYSAMLILGIIIALAAAGLQLSKLSLLTGALGVGLGFGLQNLVSNFVSGIIISLERPMKIGDLVEVDTLLGEVTAIGFRSSTVRTFEGADVIVPNSEFISKSFVNWSLKDKVRRTDILVGVAYGTDPNRVLEILARLVEGHPGVLHTFAPLITFDQFGESSLNFTVRFWSKLDGRLEVRSQLNALINDEFAKNGISIPFPQRDLHLKVDGGLAHAAVSQEETARGAAPAGREEPSGAPVPRA